MGIVLIVYGVIVLAGGILGFKMSGSMASLMSGSTSGLMLVIAGALVLTGKTSGGYFGIGITAVLILIFAMRYSKTRKMMPAGLMLALSVIVAGILYSLLLD